MKYRLHPILPRFCAPADEGKDLGGGAAVAEDYGDDFTATRDDAPEGKVDKEVDKPAAGGDKEPGDEGAEKEGESEGEGGLRDAVEHADEAVDGEKKTDTGTPKSGKGKFIPLDRHEKLLRRERARREELEAQLSQGRAGAEMARVNDSMETIENDLVQLEAQYNDHLAEGQIKEATALMTQIRHKNAELERVAQEHREAEWMARAVEKVRFDEAVERIEASYPELDREADEFDEDKLTDVLDLMTAGRQRGLSPTKALQRAVQRVMGAETAAQERATTATPRVNEAEVAAQRKREAVKRNLDTAGKTPPPTHEAGAGNDAAGGALTAKQVMEMSDEDFAKLSDKDLAKLRGDVM